MLIPGRLPVPAFRAALLVLALGAALGGCSLLGLDKDDASNDLNKDAAQYQERPVEQIYGDAWAQINKGNWEEAGKQFSFLAPFVLADNPASSDITQQQLGWQPKEKGLIADLDHQRYFATEAK